MSATPTALVLAGGAPVAVRAVGPLPEHQMVVAADSGLAQAYPLGVAVDLVVGDLDSADPAAVAAAEAAGAEIRRYPVDKDATDLELAVRAAVDAGAQRLVVVGGGGGRLDHLFGNALLLAGPALAGIAVEWRVDGYRVLVVHDRTHWRGTPGDPVSLLPVGGAAHGVTTEGLRWRLAGEDLAAGTTRGVSNEMVAATAAVSLTGGTLLAMHRRQS